MEFEDLIRGLGRRGQVVHVEHLAARPARYAAPRVALPPALQGCVPAGGLWSHQAAALDLLRRGESVALATGTASGKSLAFQLAIAEAVAGGGTALLLYPTKALAQDQLRSWGSRELPGVVAVTYDGDSTLDQRTWARRNANVILTNPDMLHAGLLPAHSRWSDFLARLRFVVLDELHTLRGIYGTHVAHLVRRLRRVCEGYGAEPSFVCCSGTIGQPAALARSVTGRDVAEVTDDGSPRGERVFALWNPALIDAAAGRRVSSHTDTARLLAAMVGDGHRAIAFTRSRRAAEVVASRARDLLRQTAPRLVPTVRPYRGGYLPSERREIESELFDGRLRGVAATNALELGIDVGGLDACILDGFPGTIASMWQQAGRAGRATQRAAAVLVAGDDALDQWFMANPKEVFRRMPEAAVVNPRNPLVLNRHVECAAYERPLRPEDGALWHDGDLDDAVLAGVQTDQLTLRDGRALWAGSDTPGRRMSLRTGSTGEYRIVDENASLVGTVDEARAFDSVHPGAIYLHQGVHYRVTHLDVDDRAAWVEPTDGSEWTQARTVTRLDVVSQDDRIAVGQARLVLGAVAVSQQVIAYQRIDAPSGTPLGTEPLDLPPTRLLTRAFWYEFPDELVADAGLGEERLDGTLHAAEHAGIGILPLFTICDRWDVGGVSMARHPQTSVASFFVYDGYPGGAGIAELGFAAGAAHCRAILDVIDGCSCAGGCPSCVVSPKCGNWNEPLDKHGASVLLAHVLDGPRPAPNAT
jgi:DEAD/DEAH box helicase domain-containing protein